MKDRNLDPYTVFEAPLPRISLYCNNKTKPQNQTHDSKKKHTHTHREKKRREVLCHIFQMDQFQQTQSIQVVQDVRDHSFSKTFNKFLSLSSVSYFDTTQISPYSMFFLFSA
ncbi:hypothetical protein OIU77_018670 [Salix suchowensis]|uniref:Uncharacterized protein n=1 Tax=Salix suchowensis TaxID=1278906 RepID=A0ABQ9CGR3_9ROSI|nr:hypothetical protein OIU77_018670 [Salix suchowensis]